MVDYKAAFKLPFTNWHRLFAYFIMVNLALFTPAFFFAKFYIEIIKSTGGIAPTAAFSGLNLSIVILSTLAFIIFGLAGTGYVLRVQSNASRGKNVLPTLDNISGLFTTALKFTVGGAVYAIAINVLYFVTILCFLLPGLLKLFGVLLLIPLIASFLFAIYAIPMLITHFTSLNRFAALFDIRKAWKYAFTVTYFVPWLVSFGYSCLFNFAAYLVTIALVLILAFLKFNLILGVSIGVVLFISVYSMAYLTMVNLYGQAYYEVVSSRQLKLKGGK